MTKKLIVLTAFGAFGDVSTNPTQEMIEHLQSVMSEFSYLNAEAQEEKIPVLYQIIPVSVQDCLDCLKLIQDQIASIQAQTEGVEEIFFIHLGVDARATFLKLEQFAYNNMSFRIPDVRGYQPDSQSINNLCLFNERLETKFPLSQVLQYFQENYSHLASRVTGSNKRALKQTDSVFVNDASLVSSSSSVNISADPGRYLCNYLYYQSLSFPLEQERRVIKSLFIHVPPFSEIDKNSQLQIISALIHSLLSVTSR